MRELTPATAFAAAGPGADALAATAVAMFARTEWLDALFDPLIAELATDPWFAPPLRVSRDALRAGAILFEDARVAIALSRVAADRLAALPPPASAIFSGRMTVTRYLRAGGARLRRWSAPPVPAILQSHRMGQARPLPDLDLIDGLTLQVDGRHEATALTGATGDVVMLTATVRVDADPVTREYDANTGEFLRMATNDEGAARAQVLLSLLRAGRAADAEGCFDRATRDAAFFLRWSAMREWLVHDPGAACGRLHEMTCDPHPDVRAAAAATLAALIRKAA